MDIQRIVPAFFSCAGNIFLLIDIHCEDKNKISFDCHYIVNILFNVMLITEFLKPSLFVAYTTYHDKSCLFCFKCKMARIYFSINS